MRPVLSPPAEERETTLGSQPAGTFTGPTYLGDPLGWTCSGVEGGTLCHAQISQELRLPSYLSILCLLGVWDHVFDALDLS